MYLRDLYMNSLERQSQIVEVVQDKGRISITDICKIFEVSNMTARRDLGELDRQGLLRRVHGGAITNLGRSYEPPFQARATKSQPAKASIGMKAADLINDGDSIALDVGTTTLEIVHGLKGKRNLTIITNAMPIANLIIDNLSLEIDARLILAGGIIRPRELSMIGDIPERVYQEFHVDKAFIGIGGISLDDGLTEYNIEDARIKRVLFSSAREKVVVADGSKFGVTTFASVAPLSVVDKIVTDRDAPPAILEEIRHRGVDVILAN
jgi:DeoR/GlpR family transcriptional regulator of sugar metabolism